MKAELRIIEALLFASPQPLDRATLARALPAGTDLRPLLDELRRHYEGRGVVLAEVGGAFTFRTAPDLAFLLRREEAEQRRLSRAAVETLAVIAYHQPITRAEIEQIRGVGLSRGTLDVLMEAEWVTPKGRRETPGRPLEYVTTQGFMAHFGLASLKDLPGLEELKAAGFDGTGAPLAENSSTLPDPPPDDELLL
ncbi:SMC-Scp complex subunit ScpB [Zavarzinia sp. CC-PAN008]|uniref:SMC-Scp complex subunit ScpB n=1 Tax=Zavarzinia sp. CC-PAN008 TaxID=3243332 RepID=UPI003F743F54